MNNELNDIDSLNKDRGGGNLQKRIDNNINQINEIDKLDDPLRPPFPKKNLLIELTNHCNHKCIFCANQKMTRPRGFINEVFLNRILNEAYELGCREVGFYTTGEPFMYNKLPECIALAKDIGFEYAYITTNGALATPEKSKAVIDAGLDSIKFSINAATKEMYELIHGKDDFDRVYENLKFIYNYRKKLNLKFNIFISHVRIGHFNSDEVIFENKFSKICDEIVYYNLQNAGGLMPEIIECLVDCNNNQNNYEICTLPFFTVNISYEGYLTACCTDFNNLLTVADLNKISLKDAWICNDFKKLRKSLIDDIDDHSLCFNCRHNLKNNIVPINSKLSYDICIGDTYNENIINNRIKMIKKKFE